MKSERDYVLGTHDEEIQRLGLQHRVWRSRAVDAWRRAGFSAGQEILDVGCGPGYASIDLAEIVGPSGKVHAIDRSRRFLDALDRTCIDRGWNNVVTHECDLNEEKFPDLRADGAWVRWVFAFVKHPEKLLSEITRTLKPGGTLVIHEYFNYAVWQIVPKSEELEEFVREVMESWRADGGEPDIGLDLPRRLVECGCSIQSLKPIVDVVTPSDDAWQWLATFVRVGMQRLVALGRVSSDRAKQIQEAFDRRETGPSTLMFTPAVLEIIAVRDK